MHIILNNNYLYFYNYKIKCSIGKNGLTSMKREGDQRTPKGKFKFILLLYRKDRINYLHSKIKKKKIKKNMGWCDDPKSKDYNKLVRLPFKFNFEKLYRSDSIYDIFFVLDFNTNPIKKNKGSAIFIHIAKKSFSSTKGCVAIKKADIKMLAKKISKNTLVRII